MLFIHLNKTNFFGFFRFLDIYIPNIASARKKMTVNDFRNFIFENYYKGIGFVKENSYYAMKHLKKRFTIVCNQVNKKKLILVMLRNIIVLI